MEPGAKNFTEWYKSTLAEKTESIYRVREAYWIEAYAVGDENWLMDIYQTLGSKIRK